MKNIKLFFIGLTIFTISLVRINSQTCGTCNNADFAAGCNQGLANSPGNLQSFYIGVNPPNYYFTNNLIGNGTTPMYCEDFTTPATVNGTSNFNIFGLTLFGAVDDGGNSCGWPLATITLYDAGCSAIAQNSCLPDPSDNWLGFGDLDVLPSTTYTMCFQTDYTCPGAAYIDYIAPQIYYQAACPIVDFTAPSSVCSDQSISWTSGASCAGLTGPGSGNGPVVDLAIWTGTGPAPDPSSFVIPSGAELISQIDPNLTIVDFDFTCGNAPVDLSGWTNETCAPITVSYYLFVFDYNLNCDGDGFLEYSPNCQPTKYDVVIYPAPFVVNLVDDGSSCGVPQVELLSEDGTVCGTWTSPIACEDNGNSFIATFDVAMSDDDGIWDPSLLSGSPVACQLIDNETVVCAGCPSCTGTYEGEMPGSACSDSPIQFTFTNCDLSESAIAGEAGYDYDLYIYSPGGSFPTDGAPQAYVPNPVAGAWGEFPIPNAELVYLESTFDYSQTCVASLNGGTVSNPTCSPITVTYFLIPYDYTYDLNPDPLTTEVGHYPDAASKLCQPLRFDVIIYPAPFTAVPILGSCGQGARVEFQSEDGTVCACNFGEAPVLPYCTIVAGDVVNSKPLVYNFLQNDYAQLMGVTVADLPIGCYTDITGTAAADCPSCACPPQSCIQRCIGEDIPVSSMTQGIVPNPALTTMYVLTDDAGEILQTSTGADFLAANLVEGDTHYIYAINYDGSAASPVIGDLISDVRNSTSCIDVSEPRKIVMICCAGAGAFPATDINNQNFPHGH